MSAAVSKAPTNAPVAKPDFFMGSSPLWKYLQLQG
jgi:hypothetical protein